MAIKSPAVFAPVVVVWEDAEAAGTDQHENPQAALYAYKPAIRRSIGFWVGYALRDGRECAVLATDDDRSEDAPHALGGTFRIPRGMILSVEPLRLAPPAKRKR